MLPARLLLPLALVLLFVHQSDANARLCGPRLITAMKAICRNEICGGGFQTTNFARKRSSIAEVAIAMELSEEAEGSNESPEVIGGVEPFVQFYKNAPPKRPGIATRCCKRRCSLDYLKTYCCSGFEIN
ncbi:IlGF domain-containing protein [Aphelenchoides fujianensis]|nr:IlGF domain-containing protein [Aphelenchoides fujianensis]